MFFYIKNWGVQELDFISDCGENQEVRLHISMCTALAVLKPEHVEDGFVDIHSEAPDNEKGFEFIV